ncbi:general substrate transporter [Limtongia smithiae]|uniref:general substrate transporter n=1 Tax=Limtongia smithiae TaxID=1125753 RepID=UPI0034CFA632
MNLHTEEQYDLDRKEGSHIEELDVPDSEHKLSRTAFTEAQLDSLAKARPTLHVFRDNFKLCAIVVAVQANGVILGLEYVLLGALVGVQAFCKTMGSYDESSAAYAVAASTLSLWAGLFGLMQFVGQMFAGWFADRYGRSKAIYLMVLNVYLGVLTEVLSRNKNDYTGAKIIMGTATGMMQVVIPTYVAEITPREIRGITIGFFSFNLSLGSLIGTLVTWAANNSWGTDINDNRSWKVPLYVGLAAPTITLIAMAILMPESPYWLVLKNRVSDAKKSLRRIHPNMTEDEIERTANQLQYTVLKAFEIKKSSNATYMECLRGPNLRRTFSAIFPSLCQQLIGNQLVQSYSTYFFTVAELPNALLGSVIVSCTGLGAAICAFFLIEIKTVGRWLLVFWGAVTITLSMLAIGIVDSVDHGVYSASAGSALVAFIAIFNAGTAVGPGVAGWSYAAEAGSARLRAKTATISVGCNAIIGTVTNIVIPFELDAIGAKTGYMFFGIGCLCLVFIYLWIPDVTGRTYAQLDELFERRIPARKFKTTECTGEYGKPSQREIVTEKLP